MNEQRTGQEAKRPREERRRSNGRLWSRTEPCLSVCPPSPLPRAPAANAAASLPRAAIFAHAYFCDFCGILTQRPSRRLHGGQKGVESLSPQLTIGVPLFLHIHPASSCPIPSSPLTCFFRDHFQFLVPLERKDSPWDHRTTPLPLH